MGQSCVEIMNFYLKDGENFEAGTNPKGLSTNVHDGQP